MCLRRFKQSVEQRSVGQRDRRKLQRFRVGGRPQLGAVHASAGSMQLQQERVRCLIETADTGQHGLRGLAGGCRVHQAADAFHQCSLGLQLAGGVPAQQLLFGDIHRDLQPRRTSVPINQFVFQKKMPPHGRVVEFPNVKFVRCEPGIGAVRTRGGLALQQCKAWLALVIPGGEQRTAAAVGVKQFICIRVAHINDLIQRIQQVLWAHCRSTPFQNFLLKHSMNSF